MPDTFSQIYIHIVFAVQNRKALIAADWEEEIYKYITGIIEGKGQKMLAINGTENHIHIFIGMRPSCCLSDLVREIKKASHNYIKTKKFTNYNFKWQHGFGAFSYSHSQISNVIEYISNQKQKHKRKTFREEYISILNAFSIKYKAEHTFEFFE